MRGLKKILELLEKEYGIPDWIPGKRDPVGILVQTILSQNTSDTNSMRAFSKLKEEFKNWYGLLETDKEKISRIIRSGGLPNVKAKRIRQSLLKIFEERGELSLDFLDGMGIYEAMAWLEKLDGVGPKTAAIVLNFGFGKNVIPVDTHVHRVAERLGMVPKTTAKKAQIILNNEVPEEFSYPLHVLFIQHGRELCKSRNPRCKKCPVKNHCDYFRDLRPGRP